ncbi:DNA polymerase III subunit beta [Halorhodospira sp. 9621]|uniref:DNA polymerase III subunit beta n=1 Tax=Halorhodospira TaxID=85108 RepID=UPI0019124BCD|nr:MULTISPECIES: DNA polymerase III subunit beta [Halorhodospira]MBK5936330.1 DNA polymerase III subunit beta [Halorhodospira halophila]MBK5943581.1 DNA polymerase III subunit beta [Halorhodospira halophila]MCG5527112.1 DNA polymerase III subunit beta [Halorhodospira halophila]MCG5532929.1 DNA polymerase III subunit beta [Halorhodospira sp. 9621]MCG5543544.1 DNA polymerase III subunit beta [Halorhodospira sp. 9628]
MRFEVQREPLLAALQSIVGVVERRQTLPVLGNIRVEARPEQLQLTATDLEVELVAYLEAHTQDEGVITLPARKWLDICRNLPEGASISIETNQDRATLRAASSRFSLATLPADEFPEVESIGQTESVDIPRTELRKLIERTHFSMAQHDVRYYLNGLLLELTGSGARAVATDGHRLALAESDSPVSVSQPRQVIVPRKGVQELLRLLDDADESATLEFGTNHVRVTLQSVRFTSKLIDGVFPDYNRVIPQDGDKHVLIDRQYLRQALTRVAILSNEKYRGIRFAVEGDTLRIGSHNPEQEEAEEEVSVDYGGDAVELGFNANYLLDALGALDTERVQVTLTDASSSGLIRGEGLDNARYVVMPMRL